MKGGYILGIKLQANIELTVGSLGLIPFKKGFYFYIGSAMASQGSSTLINRVSRHLRDNSEKKRFWHIDYLLENERAFITKVILIPCHIKLECDFVNYFLEFADDFIQYFGSSDCNCKSHLFYFKKSNQIFI